MQKFSGSRLFYHGTDDEVRIGDRVRIRRWLRSDMLGTVCYIPGISQPHPELEDEIGGQWAIRLDDGTVLAMGYCPDDPDFGQPSKKYTLIGRGEGGEIKPMDPLM